MHSLQSKRGNPPPPLLRLSLVPSAQRYNSITYCEIFRVINNKDEPGMTAVEPKGKNKQTEKQQTRIQLHKFNNLICLFIQTNSYRHDLA